MKQKLIKLLFKENEIRQYLTYSIDKSKITEQVSLISQSGVQIISQNQFVFCQVPFLIGIYTKKMEAEKIQLVLTKRNKKQSTSKLTKLNSFKLNHGFLEIFKHTKTIYHHIGYLRQKLILLYFYLKQKQKVQYSELSGFCAFYNYPRKVIISCYGNEKDYNFFPMDLVGYISSENKYILGLRNSNKTLAKFLFSKKIVVADIDAKFKNQIFKMGAHHSSTPPTLDNFDFTFCKSEKHNFIVPNIVSNYKELEIVSHKNLGSHTIMICEIVNEKIFDTKCTSLYHKHICHTLNSDIEYNLV